MTVRMSEPNERVFRDLERELAAAGRSPRTAEGYHEAMLSLEKHLRGHRPGHGAGYPGCCAAVPAPDLLAVTRADIQGWLVALRATHAKDSVASYFRSVRRVYNWAAAEELTAENPVARVTAPPPGGKPVAIPDIGDLRALLGACKGRAFADVRDRAMIRLFAETGGPRVSEVARLPLGHLDLAADYVKIEGKGGRWRGFPVSAVTARELSRYLRARDGHPMAARLQQVFLGPQGRMTPSGIWQMFERRCAQAGIARIHPHQCRHFGADAAKRAGMSDGDMMRLFGWSTHEMLLRYGAAAADARAADASRALALGNQL